MFKGIKLPTTVGVVISSVIGALILGATFAPTAAQRAPAGAPVQIIPNGTTHIGQAQSRLVHLKCEPGLVTTGSDCGTIDSATGVFTPFTVPSGSALIVTDWLWEISDSSRIGLNTCTHLVATSTGARLLISCAVVTSDGTVFGHEHLTSGVVLGSGMQMSQPNEVGGEVYGYLVPNQ